MNENHKLMQNSIIESNLVFLETVHCDRMSYTDFTRHNTMHRVRANS